MKKTMPSNWSIKKISEIANTSSGGTPSRSNVEFYNNGIYPWVKTGELGNKYLCDTEEYITEEAINNSSAKLIEKNSVIMAMYGATIGKMTINKVEVTTNQACCSISCNKNIYNYEFLYYILSLQKENIIKLGAGGAQPNISQEIIKNYKILCPPLEVQEQIVEVLSTWDLAIEKQEQLIEKKKEFKKGLMQRLLSGEVRFKEFNDKWKVVSLGNIFDRVTQKNNVECTNVLTISAQNGLVNQEDYFNKSVSSKDLSGYYLLNKGDFAYNKSYSNGYPLGAIKRLNNYDEGVVSPLYICFRAKEKISTCFYEQYFESGFLNKEIFKIAQEGARNHGLLNVSVTEFFKDIKIAQPSLEEQNKIAEVLIEADKEIELLEKELEALKLQKKGLMQRLLTGEVRVNI